MTVNLLDTNILVYSNNKDSEFHSICKSLVERAANGEIEAAVSVQNLIELYAVITDKRRVEHPLTPIKAKELIDFYKESPGIRIITPVPKTVDTIAKLIEKHSQEPSRSSTISSWPLCWITMCMEFTPQTVSTSNISTA